MSHVISVLIFLFYLTSCSSGKKVLEKNNINIINHELSRIKSLYKKQELYLEFNLDDYLITLVKNQANNNNLNTLKIDLGSELYNKLFLDKNIGFKKGKTYNGVSLPKGIYLNSSNINKSEVITASNILINLSSPVFTGKDEYCIIAYAYGIKYGMSGGVSLYIKENNKWRYLKSFDNWIE